MRTTAGLSSKRLRTRKRGVSVRTAAGSNGGGAFETAAPSWYSISRLASSAPQRSDARAGVRRSIGSDHTVNALDDAIWAASMTDAIADDDDDEAVGDFTATVR